MIEELLPFSEITNFKFERKPISLPPDLRPMWKISQIMLVIKVASRKERASILKLQVFNWALASNENMRQMKNLILSNAENYLVFIHIDPSVNRAIEFGIGEFFFDLSENGYISLTEKGNLWINNVIKQPDLFINEKEFLNTIGKRISETLVRNIFKT